MSTPLPPKQPPRDPWLLDLSHRNGDWISLETALKHAQRARSVELDKADKRVLKLARVTSLQLGGTAPPPWLAKLTSLRVLHCAARMMKTVPAVVTSLPKLRERRHRGSRASTRST